MQKHPRLRGEDFTGRLELFFAMETPPLTRGRPQAPSEPMRRQGNTPAYAGKTSPLRKRLTPCRKHPRLRGEDFISDAPPVERVRNTPAYAGKTEAVAVRVAEFRKHPRLRGEDGSSRDFCRPYSETPPLTRGRPVWGAYESDLGGNTPAYAGKTVYQTYQEFGSTETPPLTRGRQQHFVQRQAS